MSIKYSFEITTNFINGIVDSTRLTNEIVASTITIALDYIGTADGYCDIWFRSTLTAEDEIILNSIVSTHTGEPITATPQEVIIQQPKNADGLPLIIAEPRTGTEVICTTHNFCDKVTWFTNSERVNDEILTTSDGYVWQSVSINWVDMVSGRVQDDDGWVAQQMELNPGNPHGYQVVVTVDGYEKTMREPFLTSGGDYEVYWDDGYIVCFEDWTGKEVKVSYSKATDSEFILAPLPGTILTIEAAEADFTEDVEMYDAIEYNIYGYASVFAPELGLPDGEKVPISQTKYKRLQQIFNEAIGSYPMSNICGSNQEHRDMDFKDYRRTSRGLKSKIQSIPFRYGTVRELTSLYGIELRVKLTHDSVYYGTVATCTFYCTSKNL